MQAAIGDTRTVAVVEGMAGTVVIAATAAASAVAFPVTEPAGRALMMAVVVGALAARFRTWPAAVQTAITAALIVPLALAPDGAVTAGDPTPWGFTPLFALTPLLGRGYRFLAHTSAYADPEQSDNIYRGTDRTSLFVWPVHTVGDSSQR